MQELRAIAIAAIASLSLLMVPVGANAAGDEKPLNVPAPTPGNSASRSSAPAAPAAAEPAAGAGSAWSAQVAPAKAGEGIALDPRQTELVHKVSGYFSGLDTLQGNFVQTSADNKRMKGKFYVKRPGRFRFDYARPSRQIVVSDGHYLAIQDLDLNNEDRVALDETPVPAAAAHRRRPRTRRAHHGSAGIGRPFGRRAGRQKPRHARPDQTVHVDQARPLSSRSG